MLGERELMSRLFMRAGQKEISRISSAGRSPAEFDAGSFGSSTRAKTYRCVCHPVQMVVLLVGTQQPYWLHTSTGVHRTGGSLLVSVLPLKNLHLRRHRGTATAGTGQVLFNDL